MREFETALKAVTDTDTDDGMEFAVDGEVLHCYRPSDGQLAVLMASVSRSQSTANQIAGIINFFVEVLDDDSHAYLVGRLLDRRDPFGLQEVQAIMEWMIEEWTGRPTSSPSASTPSRRSGGRRSTRSLSTSTSSDSAQTGS